MNTTDKTLEIALTSPALTAQSNASGRDAYPANFKGKVPLKVKVAKTVMPDLPFLAKSTTVCKLNEEYHVWVNSQGAVSAIFPDGEKLGLLPSEFDVTEWHSENTAHSFTEAAECIIAESAGKSIESGTTLLVSYIDSVAALAKFLELHGRETSGDETITTKEWKEAITAGKNALETFNKF